ncbi:MAG: carboxypeptidase regulatory-like domain-containing protein [bacterium]|nr:carboxypeptidase regulatory-like domain-containing protein [bacterium]
MAGATEYNIYKETAEITDVTNLFQYATVNALTFTDNTSGGQQFYYVVTAVVPAGDLTGTINDTSNTAAQGALVYASLQGNPSVFGLAYTDANGNYLVETLPVGTYDVCVYKVNRPVATTTAVITEGGVVNWSYTWTVFTRTLLPLNVSGTLTNDQVYELTGPTSVAPGSVLDIEEGVTINGSSSINADTVNVLTFLEVEASDGVNSNGVMNVNGTKYKPVVFTSGRLTGTPRDGDWGGLIISGDAQNNRGRVAVGEGNTGPFGNALANALNTQSSGTAQYFRLEYGGFRFTERHGLSPLPGVRRPGRRRRVLRRHEQHSPRGYSEHRRRRFRLDGRLGRQGLECGRVLSRPVLGQGHRSRQPRSRQQRAAAFERLAVELHVGWSSGQPRCEHRPSESASWYAVQLVQLRRHAGWLGRY